MKVAPNIKTTWWVAAFAASGLLWWTVISLGRWIF